MATRAFITGITGQDGSYLAELLLSKGYEVHGLVRRSSTPNTTRIDHLLTEPNRRHAGLTLHFGDLGDDVRVASMLRSIQPQEVYHLAAQSHVRASFDEPVWTAVTTGVSTVQLLETIRRMRLDCRFYQASSSEIFGDAPAPQDETTIFRPRSPYASAKVYAHFITRIYREAYGLFAVSGILFNHESPRRGEVFVTRKITRAAARIKRGLDQYLYLGDLKTIRDWGYAPEYVEAMWLMLQQSAPDDYVIATGVGTSVEEFARLAFSHVELDWSDHVRLDEREMRPLEVDILIGNAHKAERILGWRPRTLAPALAQIMVNADLRSIQGPGKVGLYRG